MQDLDPSNSIAVFTIDVFCLSIYRGSEDLIRPLSPGFPVSLISICFIGIMNSKAILTRMRLHLRLVRAFRSLDGSIGSGRGRPPGSAGGDAPPILVCAVELCWWLTTGPVESFLTRTCSTLPQSFCRTRNTYLRGYMVIRT